LTLDGWEVAKSSSDNRSRAFDLAGRNLWVDSNRFNNTGSRPGKDGEGIICRAAAGTPIYSWAITHNIHDRGIGSAGAIGGLDADCHGLLLGWNQTAGWVGNRITRKNLMMTNCVIIGNKCGRIIPEPTALDRLGVKTSMKTGLAKPPADVQAAIYQEDAIKITWMAADNDVAGYLVERRIGGDQWHTIAYRPPALISDPENPQQWVDFTAPMEKELTYRIVAVDADDGDKGRSQETAPIRLAR
jgi:hypothetical protein